MALASLLSVGRTLRVAKDLPHRYQKAAAGSWPKFGPALRARNDQAPMKTETDNASEKDRPPSPTADSGTKGQQPTPPLRPGAGSGGARLAPSWWDRLGAWLRPNRAGLKRSSGARAVPGALGEPVQQELALENLKPCRNDLSDADWELAEPPAGGPRLGFLKNLAGGMAAPAKGEPVASRPTPAARI
jgi:hypothetical protein